MQCVYYSSDMSHVLSSSFLRRSWRWSSPFFLTRFFFIPYIRGMQFKFSTYLSRQLQNVLVIFIKVYYNEHHLLPLEENSTRGLFMQKTDIWFLGDIVRNFIFHNFILHHNRESVCDKYFGICCLSAKFWQNS